MPFRRYSGAAGGGETGPSGQGDVRHDMAWHCRRLAAGGLPGSPGGDKRGRETLVSLPLLTPQPFLRTRLPPVARLKARGPQGRLVLQGITLERSGAGRSTNQAPCTVWPRTNMRGKSRKVNSGHNSVPKSARRPESCSRTPPFRCTSPMCQRKGRSGESRGDRKPLVSCPLLSPPPDGGTPGRRRRPLRRALRGRKAASSGASLYRRKVYRQQTVKKKGSMSRWGTICKMFTFEPLTQNEKTAYII